MDVWRCLDDFRDRVASRPAIESVAAPLRALEEARFVLGGSVPDRFVALGWELFLSRRWQGTSVHWHLSAKFCPQDRLPGTDDWEDVRRIAARLGALPSPPLVARGPRAGVHWAWRER